MYICLVTVYTNIKIKGSEINNTTRARTQAQGTGIQKKQRQKKKKKSPQYDR